MARSQALASLHVLANAALLGFNAMPLRKAGGGRSLRTACVRACSDLSESILQWTDGIAGRVSRKADLLSLPKRLGGNPVQVSVANPTSKAKNKEQIHGGNTKPYFTLPGSA